MTAIATTLTEEQRLARLEHLTAKRERLLKKIAEDEKKVFAFEKTNKLLYFNHPHKGYLGPYGTWAENPIQNEAFRAWRDPLVKIETITGANRISKTFTTFCLLYCALTGKFAWESDEQTGWFWDLMKWEPPIKIRWVGQDWEKHIKAVLEPKFDELWPKSRPVESRKNNVGVRSFWTDQQTGGTIEIMSNKQESELFEGWEGHLVAYDEPPKRDIRVACARGLVDHRGREIFAMTLLKEAWVDKDVINAVDAEGKPDRSVYNIHGDYRVNIGHGITQEGIDQFAKTLNDDERSSRLDGIPSYKAGLLLKLNKKVHQIPRFAIKAHWLVDISIDIHPAKPQFVLFSATDPQNLKYICHEIVGHGDGEWIADQIIQKIRKYGLRINRIIIDPLAKSDSNSGTTTYEKIERGLARFGHGLEVASKQKDDGIIIINSLLWTPNEMPGLFYFDDLIHFSRQANGWMMGEDGKASKVDEDQCENLYRLMLLNTQYFDPEDPDEKDEYDSRKRNPVTGY